MSGGGVQGQEEEEYRIRSRGTGSGGHRDRGRGTGTGGWVQSHGEWHRFRGGAQGQGEGYRVSWSGQKYLG